VLSAKETREAQSLLGVAVRSAETIWDRRHILRLGLADGRSVVLKRRTARNDESFSSFTAEVAVLSFLNGMPTPVAPRLIAANDSLLIMEDLGPASSLAHSLLAGDRGRASADLVAYARALGAMHSWSFGRRQEFAAHVAANKLPEPHWVTFAAKGKKPFLRVAAQLGVPYQGAESEIDSLLELMCGPDGAFTGFTHSDACPDNTYIPPGVGDCRIFDFETSGWGPVALDFVYLLAPFPSCWCFASLPASVADPAIAAYREIMTNAGVALGPSWDVAVTAALGGVIVARGPTFAHALDEDGDWGTTTERPRALTWLASFTDAATRYATLPHLRSVASAMHTRLSARWPDTVTPDYPALARPGTPLAQLPEDWPSAP
jgi:aminoglycoside phosphotransferase (APT) family kinase protein